jgi:uncharacterized protein
MTDKDERFPWAFLAIAFGFNWLILLPGVLAGRGLFKLPLPVYALVAVGQFGPSLAAFILAFHSGGRAAAGQLFRRALQWRIAWRWWLVIIVVPPALGACAVALHRLSGAAAPASPLLAQPLAILPYAVFTLLLSGPVPEEFGWRGHLLPRLQSRWGALGASLVVGVIWAVWHLPAWFMPDVYQSYLPFGLFVLWAVAFSVLMTWVYNSTGGNLLAALLFHTMANVSNAVFPPVVSAPGGDQRAFLYLTLLYIVEAALVLLIAGAGLTQRQAPAKST